MERLCSRIRGWTLFFIFGLALSGATALPIPTELAAGIAVLGEDMSANGLLPETASSWLRTLREGIWDTSTRAPFMFYGTDWLAFVIPFGIVGSMSLGW